MAEKTRYLTTRLTEEMRSELEARAKLLGKPLSALVDKALQNYLAELRKLIGTEKAA